MDFFYGSIYLEILKIHVPVYRNNSHIYSVCQMHVLILKCNSDSLLIFFSLSFLTFTVTHVVLHIRKYCSLRGQMIND